MPHTRFVIGVALSSLLVAGCNGADEAGTEEEASTEAQEAVQKENETETAKNTRASVSGTFTPYEEGATAVTYDEEAVPEGSTVEVTVSEEDGGSAYTLSVAGLEANREFGTHLHTDSCGADPGDSGPHYQDEVDPEADSDTPSTDPEYANPENEVWLDFTTDDEGNATQQARVDWQPREGEANSIVLHEKHTDEHEGAAGQAGNRLACVNVSL